MPSLPHLVSHCSNEISYLWKRQTLLRQRKTTHSEVVSFCRSLGRETRMLWWPQLLQKFLRISTMHERNALKLWHELWNSFLQAEVSVPLLEPRNRNETSTLPRRLSSLKLRVFLYILKLHTCFASFAFGTVLSFHCYFHRTWSFKLNSTIKFREKINVRAFFF